MNDFYDSIASILGIGTDTAELGYMQLTARAVTIYLATLLLIRLGRNRFLGKNTAFDVVLGFIFGSMLSRAINGSDTLFQTVVAAGVMLAVHWLVSYLGSRSERVDHLLEGRARELVRDGEVDEKALSRALMNREELATSLRLTGHVGDVTEVQRAVLERNGEVSVLTRRTEPRVLEVQVADGVQTVRIALG